MNLLLGGVLLALTAGAPLGAAQGTAAQATVSAAPEAETPSQFYLRYLATVVKAKTLEEVQAFWRPELIKEFNESPPDQRLDLAAFQRMYGRLSGVRVTNAAISATGGSATLTLEANSPDHKRLTSTTTLEKQAAGWKIIAPEDWQ